LGKDAQATAHESLDSTHDVLTAIWRVRTRQLGFLTCGFWARVPTSWSVILNEVKNLPEFLISRLKKDVGEQCFDYNFV